MRDDYPLLFALAAVGLTVGCQRAPRADGPTATSRVAPAPESHAERNGTAKPASPPGERDSE